LTETGPTVRSLQVYLVLFVVFDSIRNEPAMAKL